MTESSARYDAIDMSGSAPNTSCASRFILLRVLLVPSQKLALAGPHGMMTPSPLEADLPTFASGP
jgi:hypothetical protein